MHKPHRFVINVIRPDDAEVVTVNITTDHPSPEPREAEPSTIDNLKRTLVNSRANLTWREWQLFDAPREQLAEAVADLNASARRALMQSDTRDAWAIFDAAARRHRDVGAQDSEPRNAFSDLMVERFGPEGQWTRNL